MKSNVISPKNGSANTAFTNTKTLSQQIENLRVVLRRTKNNHAATDSLDSLISQKLKAAK